MDRHSNKLRPARRYLSLFIRRSRPLRALRQHLSICFLAARHMVHQLVFPSLGWNEAVRKVKFIRFVMQHEFFMLSVLGTSIRATHIGLVSSRSARAGITIM